MSIWQFMAALDGYAQANNPSDGKSLSGSEMDAIWERVKDG